MKSICERNLVFDALNATYDALYHHKPGQNPKFASLTEFSDHANPIIDNVLPHKKC